ncbi:hypothetical protein [Kingella potus]|nr:hypothetical protein [Kingella potus]
MPWEMLVRPSENNGTSDEKRRIINETNKAVRKAGSCCKRP